MRRLATLLLLASVLALPACGGESDPTRPDAQAPSAQADAGAFPVEVKDKLGSARIDAAPKRVLALDTPSADAALAVGVVPVGIAKVPYAEGGLLPWTTAALDRLGAKRPTLITPQEYNVEEIAAQRPDLILAVGAYGVEKVYDKLGRIAPVVAFEHGAVEDTWEDSTLRIGRALGREGQARERVAAARDRVEQTSAEAGLRGRTVSFFNFVETPFVVKEPDDASVRFLAGLGLRPPPAARALPQAPGGRTEVSLEKLDVLEADVIVSTSPDPGSLKDFERRPVFRRLEAVRAGHYVRLNLTEAVSMAFPSVLSVPWSLDHVVPKLEAAA
jgi:iron complex transport system substrate-binding protein